NKLLRQVKFGSYGIVDLLGIDIEYPFGEEGGAYYTLSVYELKNTPLKSDHLIQCSRYYTYLKNLSETSDYKIIFNISLIGLKTFPSAQGLEFLAQSIDWLEVYEIRLDPKTGLIFHRIEGWITGNDDSSKNIASFVNIIEALDDK
ncbi:MAG: hypothetical protein R8M45_00095, partial [Ghiorsea sp.]